MCGTETLEFSSNTLVIKPLQRILSMHWNKEQRRFILSVRDHLPVSPGSLRIVSPTWLMSLVHAAFSWRDGAKRTTENGGPSGGSTTILNSRWLKPWPAALSEEKGRRRRVWSPSRRHHSFKNSCEVSVGGCTAAHSPHRWCPAPRWGCIRSGRAFLLAVGKVVRLEKLMCDVSQIHNLHC